MKKIISIVIILIICLSLSGCDYSIVSVDNLMRPPKLSGESSELQEAFEKTLENPESVILKNSISGNYRSSFLFYDLDNDKQSEAFVFYSEPETSEMAFCSVFKKVNDNWVRVNTIKGRGEEIYEIDFADVNGDDVFEIVISWTFSPDNQRAISNSLSYIGDRILTLYSYSGNNLTLMKSENFTKLYIDDFNNDDSDELLLLNINLTSSENRTTARIIEFDANYSISMDNSLTLSNMLEIHNIVTDSLDGRTRIFIDGSVSENTFITEILDINHENFEITLPLYESNTSVSPSTIRTSQILSKDIDDDGIIEIPTLEMLNEGVNLDEGSEAPLFLTVWSEFGNEGLKVDFKCLLNVAHNYYYIFPDSWNRIITAKYYSDNSTLKFTNISDGNISEIEIFKVKTFTLTDWENYNGEFIKFDEDGVFVYAYIYNDSTEYTQNDFIENFVIID